MNDLREIFREYQIRDLKIAYLLENKFTLIHDKKYKFTHDPEEFVSRYFETLQIMSEFGITDEKWIADKFISIWSTNLREKCLIMENFKCLDLIVNHSAVHNSFKKQTNTIYARLSFYKEMKPYQQEEINVYTFLSLTDRKLFKRYGIKDTELIEKYPLTKQKLQLMERIHNAKKNAQTKSGGVSL